MKNKTCCFSGHRIIPKEEEALLTEKLKTEVEKKIKAGYRYFAAGGALGFDTMAEKCVLELREKYPDIRLILVLPCISQSNGFSEYNRKIYEDIKSLANKVVYTSEKYFRGCMQKRNRCLVDNSSSLICYLTEKTGGTSYTVKYADKNGLDIVNLAQL